MQATVTRNWKEPEPIEGTAWRALHDDALLAELLWRRGIRDVRAATDFLDPRPRPCPDGSGLPNFEDAVARVARAISAGERIGIFGDYDADGITATAILMTFLEAALGDPDLVEFWLPSRDEGYGLSEKALQSLRHIHDASLLIVADTGSTDHVHVPIARELGLDVVILDHHQIDEAAGAPDGAITVSAYLPTADPERVASLRELTGAGLAWVLVTAVAKRLGSERLAGVARDFQDLAALGTVADVAPLNGINRCLVRDGLRLMRTQPRPGIQALCDRVGIATKSISATDIAMKLAPRLNAAGRMDSPLLAYELLREEQPSRAARMADRLEAINDARKAAMNEVQAAAVAWFQANLTEPGGLLSSVLVAHDPRWSPGVLGPAAAKIAEKYHKPVLLLSDGPDGTSTGSVRSVAGFDIAAALRTDACQVLLERHGGHSAAAGITLRTECIPDLARALDAAWEEARATVESLGPTLVLDAELPLARLTRDTARLLGRLSPFGQGNEVPLLLVRNAPVRTRRLFGRDPNRQHLKLVVGTPGSPEIEVLLWGGGDRFAEAANATVVDLAVRIALKKWNGDVQLEVIAEDFRIVSA